MGEISLQDAMQLFLKNSKFKTHIQAVQVEELWEKMMGKTVAKYTDKIQIIGTTLFITTAVAPLRHELLYQKDIIMQRVNETLGANSIKEVVIK
ncbi:MAG: DUF721 domain-containing protein [Chitinophagaceae bacterium]|nr:MAG: DUF721 domain-containing protein [Chitinophagaceae bacterium]